MLSESTSRRGFIAGTSAVALDLSLKYASPVRAQSPDQQPYGAWEDLMREKWTWDQVFHSTHGTNCAGNCAFNVYVKDGIVWREEQQGEYGKSAPDVPDYSPRGCQKGLRHAKYMYGNQRVLYPMKRVGARGEGKWERISWEQGLAEVADKFIDTTVIGHLRTGHPDGDEASLVRIAGTLRDDLRFAPPRGVRRCRRSADGRPYDGWSRPDCGHIRRRFQVEVLSDLVLQSGSHTNSGRPFFLGGEVQRYGSHRDFSGIYTDGHACQQVGESKTGHRRGSGVVDGLRNYR